MSELKTEHQYVLKSPITYDHKGNQETAEFILLKAPSAKHSKECAALKQAFFRAIPDQAPEDGTPDEVKGEDVLTMIAMSKDVDLGDVLETARRLFLGGVALVDGEVKLTKPLAERLHQDDLEGMFGDYMVNFTLASSLERMKSSTKAS